jgi:hypothetical protein
MGAPAGRGWERIYHGELADHQAGGFPGWIAPVDTNAAEAIPVLREKELG